MSSKAKIRNIYSCMRNMLDRETINKNSSKICGLVLGTKQYENSDLIMLYYPIKSEVNVLPIMNKALEDGKRVAFPVSNKDDFTMTFKYVNSMDDLQEGTYGVLEPREECESVFSFDALEKLIIVPGLVYDKSGYRVGYGKGYYDRFLESFNGYSIGVVYSKFLLDSVERNKYDQSVDMIVTEEGNFEIR